MKKSSLKIRENILKISHASGHGHIPTCFSVIEMIEAVYDVMTHSPDTPEMDDRDIFILSKGHAALAHYCVLAENAYFSIEDVYSFGGFKSTFGCHADRMKIPGVEASTGSLGHGIGIAVGIAMALKLKNSSRKVYTLIGDGESNEGSVWEAVMVASHQKLNNLTILFDNNKSQSRCMPIPNPQKRFAAFACDTSVVDGHSLKELTGGLNKKTEQVHVIVANTKKGFGSSTLTNDMFAWHRRSPNQVELAQLIEEVHENAI